MTAWTRSGAQRVDRHRGAERRIRRRPRGRARRRESGCCRHNRAGPARRRRNRPRRPARRSRAAPRRSASPSRRAPRPCAPPVAGKPGSCAAERAVGVEDERAALEHQFVLAADLVEIDQRQAAFDDPRHGDVLADRELVALIGRGVGHEQDFAAGLGDALDRVRPPDVLADRHADAHAAKRRSARARARAEHALLVEHAVIGQIDLEPHRLDAPARRAARRRCRARRPRPRAGRPAPPGRRRRSRAPASRRRRGRPPGRRASAPDPRADSRRGTVRAPARGRRRTRRPPRAPRAAGRDCRRCRRRRGDLRKRDDEAVGGSGHGRAFAPAPGAAQSALRRTRLAVA